jgi:hypothetical protein
LDRRGNRIGLDLRQRARRRRLSVPLAAGHWLGRLEPEVRGPVLRCGCAAVRRCGVPVRCAGAVVIRRLIRDTCPTADVRYLPGT